MEETTTTALTVKTEEVSLILSGLPAVLQANTASIEKAKSVVQALIDTIEAEGMNDALDAECNKTIHKLALTKTFMMEGRKPATQIMDSIKKEFTSLEAWVDTKNTNSLPYKLQSYRDAYAKNKMEEQRKKEAETQRQLAIDKEKITVRSFLETKLAEHFNNYVAHQKRVLNTLLENATLDNWDEQTAIIFSFKTEYSYDHFNAFKDVPQVIYMQPAEIEAMRVEVSKGKYGDFSSTYAAEISLYKDEVKDKLPSKKTELEAAKETARKAEAAAQAAAAAKAANDAAAAEKARIAAEAAAEEARIAAAQKAERDRIENERIAKERAEAQSKADAAAQAAAMVNTTNATIEAQLVLEMEAPAAKVKEGVKITVLNSVAYLAIVSFYFEHEGKTKTPEELEKKTLGSMVKFAEKMALTKDLMIEHSYLKYEETFKAATVKTK